MSEFKIYVADLAAYNSAILHGVWINALDDIEDIQEQVATMLKNSPIESAEEYAIHDYEGFNGYSLSECEGLEAAHTIACYLSQHENYGADLLCYAGDIESAQRFYDDGFQGEYSDLEDYARNFTEETSTDIPEHLTNYIDYERMGRDMELSGDIFTIETRTGDIAVFWSHC